MAIVNANEELTLLQKIKWGRGLLEIMGLNLVMQQFAETPDVLDDGEGQTLRFTRVLPHGKLHTDMTDLDHGDTDSGEVNIPGFTQFDVSPVAYGNHQTFDLYDTRQAFLSYVDAAKKSYGQWYGEGLDYKLTKMIAQSCWLMRADGDTDYEFESTASANGTSTTLVDTVALDQADDYWNGGIVVFTSGKNIGEARIVSDFVNGTGTATFSVALPNATVSGDGFHISVTTLLATGDKMTTTIVRKVVRTLEDNRAPKYEGGLYVGVLDSYQKYDYIESLISIAQYTTQGIKQIFQNEIGTANGVRFVYASKIFRADAALYAESVTGAVRVSLFMGKGAYGTVKCDGSNLPKLTLQSPLGGSTDPHYKKGQLGVSVTHAPTMLNSLNVVGLCCVASA